MHASSTPPPAKSAFDLVEEAFHLVRRLPLHDLAAYYIGTLPFLAGLLYFWVDMTHHSVPDSRVLLEALGVTLLFIWMKIWQVSYARRLWRLVAVDQPAAAVVAAPARWVGMIGRQTMIHASGLVALPVALVFAVPFGAVYAFYQNATILEDMTDDLTGLQRRAMKMATAWPRQNHLLIWSLSPVLLVAAFAIYVVLVPIMSAVTPEWSSLFLTIYSTIYLLAILPLTPFAVVTALNIATVLIVLPHLIKMLTGTPLLFLTNSALILNSFFMAVVCALTWCALDPIIKAAYLLRCFYLASLLTGEDLRAQLARYARVLVVAAPLLFVLASAPAVAAPEIDQGPAESVAPALEVQPAVAPGELDRAIDVVMAGSEYEWRLPRQPNEGGIVSKFFMQVAETLRHWAEVVGHWLDKLGDWLSRRLSRGGDDEAGGGGASTMQVVLYVAVGLLVAALAAALFMYFRGNYRTQARLVAQPLTARPDLEDEATLPDALPEEAWLKLVDEMREQGNLRLALRAAFLATLTTLARCGLITVARFKSNYDYRCELGRRIHSAPQLAGVFSASARIYDSVWYGEHETTADLLQAVLQNRERLEHATTD